MFSCRCVKQSVKRTFLTPSFSSFFKIFCGGLKVKTSLIYSHFQMLLACHGYYSTETFYLLVGQISKVHLVENEHMWPDIQSLLKCWVSSREGDVLNVKEKSKTSAENNRMVGWQCWCCQVPPAYATIIPDHRHADWVFALNIVHFGIWKHINLVHG